MIRRGQKNGEIAGRGRPNKKSHDVTLNLDDIGVEKSQSSRCPEASRCSAETGNCITYGRLKIEAKLGELMPAQTAKQRGAKGGRGKKKATQTPLVAFSEPTITTYRKVKAHEAKLDDYRKAATTGPAPTEMSTAGFIRFVTAEKRAARDTERAADRLREYHPAKGQSVADVVRQRENRDQMCVPST